MNHNKALISWCMFMGCTAYLDILSLCVCQVTHEVCNDLGEGFQRMHRRFDKSCILNRYVSDTILRLDWRVLNIPTRIPWLMTIYIWRIVMAALLYLNLSKILSQRRKEGRREYDSV
jgi:hypothetical protein